jgi:hypothetical protein
MFIKDMKATFEFWTYYKPTSYHGIRIDLLKQSNVDVCKHIYERMWNSIHKYWTTICFKSWDNVAQHPLFNILLVFSNVNVLVGAIDTIREGEDVQYMGPNTLKWTKKYICPNPNFKYGSFFAQT